MVSANAAVVGLKCGFVDVDGDPNGNLNPNPSPDSKTNPNPTHNLHNISPHFTFVTSASAHPHFSKVLVADKPVCHQSFR